ERARPACDRRSARSAGSVHPSAMCVRSLVVIFLLRTEQVTKMSFTEHNNMVKAVPPDRADEPLHISVLPWRPWCNRPIPNAHCSNAAREDLVVDATRALAMLCVPKT